MKISHLPFLLLGGAAMAASPSREYSLDGGWKFLLKGSAPPSQPCPAKAWSIPLPNMQTAGLVQSSAITEELCADQCCADVSCETYQYCNSSACGSGPPQQATCRIGKYAGAATKAAPGWFGMARAPAPPAPPTPASTTGCTEAWCEPTTNDAHWRSISVPHDFVVEGNFSSSADKVHGYLPFGVGYYRKHLPIPADVSSALQAGTHTAFIHFEGAQTHSTVYLDGQLLGSHAYGYTPFRFHLNASALAAGRTPVLAVEVDATKPDSWWYDGGGIYRHVRLVMVPMVHLSLDGGVYAPATVTGTIDQSNMQADAQVSPTINVTSLAGSEVAFGVVCVLKDASGAVVGQAKASGSAKPHSETIVSLPAIAVTGAKLWGPGHPVLYTVETTLTTSASSDASTVTIGVRKTHWDPNTGFHLNDQPTKIQGAANHQDFAGVGVAVPDWLQHNRVWKLQEMGHNGWRTAHNPPNPALLDAADQLGMLVWDENHRNGLDDELTRMVFRDRNHPCIIIWSICNEKLCNTETRPASHDTKNDAIRMNKLYHTLDPLGQRVVSANFNAWLGPTTPLDLQGIDYSTKNYDKVHADSPLLPAISSETSSAVSDRGEYADDAAGGHVTGYDTEHPGWGETAEGAWGGIGQSNGQGILTRPFVSGGFTWTGWDYKGEPTPDSWPDINSHFGILDICGFPKDRYYWYQSVFKTFAADEGMLHLFPHWNWAKVASQDQLTPEQSHLYACKGMCHLPASGPPMVEVWAFTNGHSSELFVNGISAGVVTPQSLSHANWSVPYAAGNITAVAYNAAKKVIATSTVRTTGAPASLRLSVKDSMGNSTAFGHAGAMVSGCQDVALLMVEVVDASGLLVPSANEVVTFEFSGPGLYLGGGNGDPAEHTPDHSLSRPAYHGLLLGVFQATDQAGTITVTASAPGLSPASLSLTVKAPTFASQWWCPRLPQI